MEIVKVYDVGHFTHRVFDGYYEKGELTYNCQLKRKPIRKQGQVPCELLNHYSHWYTQDDVESTLSGLGFKKKNEVDWYRE